MRVKRPLRPLFGLLFTLLSAPAPAAPPDAPPAVRLPAPPPDWLPHYDLDIRLDLKGHVAQVKQRVTWTNRSTLPVHEIVFNAHSHYVVPKKDVGLLAKTLEILRTNPDEGIYTGEIPFDLHHAVAGGQQSPAHYTGDTDTDLVVPLAGPLAPGQAVTVELDYTFHLPQKQGRWGQWEGVTFLSNWLPVVAVYDDKGWQPTPFIPWHQPFFNEAGLYTARVVLPADQKVACSGTVTGRRDLPDGQQQVDITANGVRDFALLCSAASSNTPPRRRRFPACRPCACTAWPSPSTSTTPASCCKQSAEVMPYYSRWFGPYPFPTSPSSSRTSAGTATSAPRWS